MKPIRRRLPRPEVKDVHFRLARPVRAERVDLLDVSVKVVALRATQTVTSFPQGVVLCVDCEDFRRHRKSVIERIERLRAIAWQSPEQIVPVIILIGSANLDTRDWLEEARRADSAGAIYYRRPAGKRSTNSLVARIQREIDAGVPELYA